MAETFHLCIDYMDVDGGTNKSEGFASLKNCFGRHSQSLFYRGLPRHQAVLIHAIVSNRASVIYEFQLVLIRALFQHKSYPIISYGFLRLNH